MELIGYPSTAATRMRRVGELLLGVPAQFLEQVAALHRGQEGLLHQLREPGVPGGGEPRLGLLDRGCQRGRGTAAGAARDRVRGRLPLAHEVADRVRVTGHVGLVELLHERLRVAAAGLVGLEVGMAALVASRNRVLRSSLGGGAGGGGTAAIAAVDSRYRRSTVSASGVSRASRALQRLHLHVDHADPAQVLGVERLDLAQQRRVLDLEPPRAGLEVRRGHGQVDQASEDAVAVHAQSVVVVLVRDPRREVREALHRLLGEPEVDVEVLGVGGGGAGTVFALSTSSSNRRGLVPRERLGGLASGPSTSTAGSARP